MIEKVKCASYGFRHKKHSKKTKKKISDAIKKLYASGKTLKMGWRKHETEKERIDARFASLIKHKYNLTLKDYNKLQKKQSNKCGICSKISKLYIDHNHTTGKVRKLLCPRCNFMLGICNENIKLLNKIIKYIKKYGK